MPNILKLMGIAVGKAQRCVSAAIYALSPKSIVEIPDMNYFDWEDVKDHLNIVNVGYAVVGLAGVFIIYTVIQDVPVLSFSVITFIAYVLQEAINYSFGVDLKIAGMFNSLGLILIVIWRDQVGSIFAINNIRDMLPKFAMREEIAFRAGSEKWNIFQKLQSCLVFGVIHITMLLVPVSVAIALSFAGAMFMLAYHMEYQYEQDMEEALRRSAAVHTIYNVIVIITIVIGLIALLFGVGLDIFT